MNLSRVGIPLHIRPVSGAGRQPGRQARTCDHYSYYFKAAPRRQASTLCTCKLFFAFSAPADRVLSFPSPSVPLSPCAVRLLVPLADSLP